ncbi:MAG TPA: VTT domain-containing protein [Candidatus Binatia bacterium]
MLLTLPAAWRWTPLNQWINFERIIYWQESVQSYSGAFFLVMGAYLLGSLVLFPVTILNVATVFTFGPFMGNAYALAGWLASAAMGYGIGFALGWDLLHKMAGPRLHRLVVQAEHHGFLAVLTMRVLPVAPFTLVNVFVGASGIGFWDFFWASIVGRIPGVVILSLAGVQLENALRSPEVGSFVLIGLTLVLIPLVTVWVAKQLSSAPGKPRRAARSHRTTASP